MKSIFKLLMLWLLLLNGCIEQDEDTYYDLNEAKIFLFNKGDELLYISNNDNYDTLIIDSYDLYKFRDNPYTDSDIWQTLDVDMHFLSDKHNISVYNDYIECKMENDIMIDEECDTLFEITYNSYISFYVSSKHWVESLNKFHWKSHPPFDTRNDSGAVDIVINGQTYQNVFIFERSDTIDYPELEFSKIYFNYKYGVLKFENLDGEVYELQGKIE